MVNNVSNSLFPDFDGALDLAPFRTPFGPPFGTLFDNLFDQDVHRFDRKAPEKALKRGSFLRPLFGPPSELQNERGPTWELGGGALLLPSQPLK